MKRSIAAIAVVTLALVCAAGADAKVINTRWRERLDYAKPRRVRPSLRPEDPDHAQDRGRRGSG